MLLIEDEWMQGHNKVLYIEPCAGLGNRLLALGSALFWAKKLDRELVVLWKKESACAVAWKKIFESHQAFIVKEYNQMPKKLGNILSVQLGRKALKNEAEGAVLLDCHEVEKTWDDNDSSSFEKEMITDKAKLYIRAYCRFAPADEVSSCIRTISFSNEIVKRVADTIREDISMFGVHIRRTDHMDSINMSPTELYKDKMRSIVFRNPDCVFYIATDDQAEMDEINSEFRCITATKYSRRISRTSDEGIMDAAVDMLCLSRCKKILGAYKSTFSLVASVIGNVPLEVVIKE